MIQDVRFALRILIKSPGFTLVAAIALALGIGANTAIFSAVNAVLLQPLAYAHPERLAMIWQHVGTPPIAGQLGGSAPDYIDYRNQSQSMEAGEPSHEIGIRMALGAHAADVVRMLLRQGVTPALAGILIGVAAAFALTRVMRSLLFEIQPADPLTFLAVSILLGAAAFAATYLPARRATRIDPIEALRYE